MQEPIFPGVIADITARCQVLASKLAMLRDLHVSVFHLNNLPRRPSLEVSGRIIEATASEDSVSYRHSAFEQDPLSYRAPLFLEKSLQV